MTCTKHKAFVRLLTYSESIKRLGTTQTVVDDFCLKRPEIILAPCGYCLMQFPWNQEPYVNLGEPGYFRLRIAAAWSAVSTHEYARRFRRLRMGAAYFRFINADGSDEDLYERGFVFELNDPLKIAHARRILSGEEREQVHVAGRIIARSMPYNPEWSYCLDPVSVSFFARSDGRTFDANMYYIEDHIDEVGGVLLPGHRWCPSDSRLVAEVKPEMD
jgi:hypothetical protein